MSLILAGAVVAAPPPIIINEFNAVGSAKYIEDDWFDVDTRGDAWVAANYPQLDQVLPSNSPRAGQTAKGRIQGNLGDWVELVVLQDNTDIRGWSLQMSELGNINEGNQTVTDGNDLWVGDGNREQSIVTFSNNAIWSNLRAGTIITVSEQDEIGVDTRTGIVNGDNRDSWGNREHTYYNLTGGEVRENLGTVPEPNVVETVPGGYEPDVFIDLATDTSFDPVGSGTPTNPGEDSDSWIHVSTKWERDNNAGNELVTTQTNILDNDGETTKGSGLFDIGNNDFIARFVDENGDQVVAPIGEPGRSGQPAQAGFDSSNVAWNGSGVSSNELGKLEEDPFFTQTVDLGGGPVEIEFDVFEANFNDGKSSTFGSENTFGTGNSGNPNVQDFSLVRQWLSTIVAGDTDLDGDVDSTDATNLSGGWTSTLTPGTANQSWRQGDFDDDGDVDSVDRTVQNGNFTGSQSGAAAPFVTLATASVTTGDGQADLIYDPITGNVILDATDVGQIISFFLEGNGNVFDTDETNLPFIDTGTNTDNVAFQIGQTDALNIGFTGQFDLGDVLATGLTQSELEAAFKQTGYVFALGQGVQTFDIGIAAIPEPATVGLILLGGGGLLYRRRAA